MTNPREVVLDRNTNNNPKNVLAQLLDGLTDSPPPDRCACHAKGYSAAIRFARICVLDEIALVSGSFEKSVPPGSIRRDHGSVRTRAALRAINARISREFPRADAQEAAGYRSGIAYARGLIAELERRLSLDSMG